VIFRVGGVCAALVLALALTGCSTLTPPAETPSGELLAGRMSVQVAATETEPAHNLTASFELSGTPQQGRLDMNTPLGSTVARARWSPEAVVLDTPQGQTRHANLDELTRAVVGEALPVPALFDWLRGRPWPGAISVATAAPEPTGFSQLGWRVDLSRFDEFRLTARRAAPPVVTVQVKLDPP
jgi:outer membrane lipoprotein LolB